MTQAVAGLRAAGVSGRDAARLTGMSRAGAHRRATAAVIEQPPLPRPAPSNRLSSTERARILGVLNSDRFVDSAPIEVFATLLDEGIYLGSISTFYRVLAQNRQVQERRRQARHPACKRPELIATGPGQVFTWDITKLPGPVKGVYYDAYVMIDIFSRYIVGWHVAATESAQIAHDFITHIFGIQGIPATVHADRGTSMTSKKVADLLADLGVTKSHSRPHVSNDNPYSEAGFKTLKYHPSFPERFGCIADARAFCEEFFTWYNHEHHHTGIGLHTPAAVHYGLHIQQRTERQAVLDAAHAIHPERFSTRPTPPKIPDAAWINQPDKQPETDTEEPSTEAA